VLIGTFLFIVGLAVATTYFVLFGKTMKASPAEAEKYTKAFLGKRKLDWIIPLLVVAALLVDVPLYSFCLFAAAIGFGAASVFYQDRRMRDLHFTDTFRLRLLRISGLTPVAIAFFLAGQIWRAS